jgi:hypothetical protein
MGMAGKDGMHRPAPSGKASGLHKDKEIKRTGKRQSFSVFGWWAVQGLNL